MGEHGGHEEGREPINSVEELHEAIRQSHEEQPGSIPAPETDEDDVSELSDPSGRRDPDVREVREAYRKAREDNRETDEDADPT
jgi:hypothetical protein